ncbi:MAG: hypothetical protein JSU63_11460 [Phycisphaerales bacterium]|nr:MAG: hypothetical protein JSU63_11460 [Phycisphaerales bacterium]
MRNQNQTVLAFCCALFVLSGVIPHAARACSTVMLKKAGRFVVGHNLDQPGVRVPGYIVVNKRGVFKIGRTWAELMSKTSAGGSSLNWVSRYGSVSFNIWGKDLIDGGVNDQGLYIWEMSNVFTQYPADGRLPKLSASNWMQYVLDNFHKVEEVVEMASAVQLDGPGWHFFVADRQGDCAVIHYIGGQAIVRRKDNMPVPALFNRTYDLEQRRLKCFRGFGGQYDASLQGDAPRFVHAAVMLEEYVPQQDPVDYGFMMLSQFSGDTPSQWSVVFDYSDQRFYFKTDVNPDIKTFSMLEFDFSNQTPARYLDIDTRPAGEVANRFKELGAEELLALVERMPFADQFGAGGGLSVEELKNRAATHHQAAALPENHHFVGTWSAAVSIRHPLFQAFYPGLFLDDLWQVEITAAEDAVFGEISNKQGPFSKTSLDNFQLVNERLSFTVRVRGAIVTVEGVIREDTLNSVLYFDGFPLAEITFSRGK